MFYLLVNSQKVNHESKYVMFFFLTSKGQSLLLQNYILPKLVKPTII
jgi:hypothetical protein